MSNIALFKSGALAVPDFLRESDDLTKGLAGGSAGKQISIKGGVWRMLVGGEEIAKNEDRAMNFIIVAANPNVNRTFYLEKFEENKDVRPACWSNDGVKPDAEVPDATRQHNACDGCPQNIAGSGEGKSRACRYSKRLAVVLENDITGNVYRIQVPPKSLFGRPEGDKMPLQAYAKFLAGHGVPITGVVTEARFDTSEAVPVMRFRAVRPLTREEWLSVKEAGASEDAIRAVEFKLMPKAAPDAPPAPPAFAEPVARPRSKPTPQPAAAKSAADVLSAWSDDDDA